MRKAKRRAWRLFIFSTLGGLFMYYSSVLPEYVGDTYMWINRFLRNEIYFTLGIVWIYAVAMILATPTKRRRKRR